MNNSYLWLPVSLGLITLSLLRVGGDSVNIVNALVGGNITLNISESLPENVREITWFCTYDQKIADWDVKRLKYFDNKFKGRVRLDSQSGALYLSRVQKEDANIYIMRVLKDTMFEQDWKIRLQVFDEVDTPNITLVNTTLISDTCYVNFSCSHHDSLCYTSNENCTWYHFSQNITKTPPWNHSASSNSCYTCEFKNPVHRKNITMCISGCGQTGIKALATRSPRRYAITFIVMILVAVLCTLSYCAYTYGVRDAMSCTFGAFIGFRARFSTLRYLLWQL
ncbi:membrane protein A43 [Aotine betaherpesvirus 1]|uniref:Membrane protein A43 n=1 Tax=Aotine betaherpesvirus 1 TaxID=50290 RepID=G8XUM1_9BETA|nr:membrane protein A43 [Aotine betaherpesvirus 1]AEV80863.1 membrane protein A43 [Aotine betaherpesvirus 1]